jgi:hypothetical protein
MQTDVEVLKSEIGGLRGSITEIAAKIDFLISLQVQIVRLETQHDTLRRDIDEAFSEIRGNDSDIGKINTHVNKALGGLRVLLLALTVLGAAANLYLVDKMVVLKENQDEIKVIDRRITVLESKPWPELTGGK